MEMEQSSIINIENRLIEFVQDGIPFIEAWDLPAFVFLIILHFRLVIFSLIKVKLGE